MNQWRSVSCAGMSTFEAIFFGLLALIAFRVRGKHTSENCNNHRGVCKPIADCPVILSNYHLIYNQVKYCDEFNDVVCCPQTQLAKVPVHTKRIHEIECKKFGDIRGNCPLNPFIVNGKKAESQEFPFMALIGLNDQNKNQTEWICGGSLISPNFVLTAAHCLVTKTSHPIFRVRLGELDYATNKDKAQPQDFDVKNYVLHPGYYENDEQYSDIALMELDHNATLNNHVIPACLPTTNGVEFPQLTATGWGLTTDSGVPSSHLLKVTLDRFSHEQCQKLLTDTEINWNTQLCAGSYSDTSDTCQGDSGGPVFVQHPALNCMKQIIGITSFGSICGTQNLASVYTRVHLYVDWIEKIVWD